MKQPLNELASWATLNSFGANSVVATSRSYKMSKYARNILHFTSKVLSNKRLYSMDPHTVFEYKTIMTRRGQTSAISVTIITWHVKLIIASNRGIEGKNTL